MRSRGFTLIELLVVISIIALLSSVVVASLNSARDKAKYAVAAQGMKQIDVAFNQLYQERGCWPREGHTDCGGYSSASNPTVETLVATPSFGLNKYLSVAPQWPFSSNDWWYDNDGDSTVVPCVAHTYAGIRVVIDTVTADQYRELNRIFDGDTNPDTTIARGCGKIIFTGTTGTGELSYRLSESQ